MVRLLQEKVIAHLDADVRARQPKRGPRCLLLLLFLLSLLLILILLIRLSAGAAKK